MHIKDLKNLQILKRISFNSEGTYEETRKILKKLDKYIICHNGVDIKSFKVDYDVDLIKKDLNIDTDKNNYICWKYL